MFRYRIKNIDNFLGKSSILSILDNLFFRYLPSLKTKHSLCRILGMGNDRSCYEDAISGIFASSIVTVLAFLSRFLENIVLYIILCPPRFQSFYRPKQSKLSAAFHLNVINMYRIIYIFEKVYYCISQRYLTPNCLQCLKNGNFHNNIFIELLTYFVVPRRNEVYIDNIIFIINFLFNDHCLMHTNKIQIIILSGDL